MDAPPPETLSRYLVELRRPDSGWSELEALTSRARAAAAREGAGVRFLRAVFVPEDETFFLLFESGASESVRRALERAGLAFAGFAATGTTDHEEGTRRAEKPAERGELKR